MKTADPALRSHPSPGNSSAFALRRTHCWAAGCEARVWLLFEARVYPAEKQRPISHDTHGTGSDVRTVPYFSRNTHCENRSFMSDTEYWPWKGWLQNKVPVQTLSVPPGEPQSRVPREHQEAPQGRRLRVGGPFWAYFLPHEIGVFSRLGVEGCVSDGDLFCWGGTQALTFF